MRHVLLAAVLAAAIIALLALLATGQNTTLPLQSAAIGASATLLGVALSKVWDRMRADLESVGKARKLAANVAEMNRNAAMSRQPGYRGQCGGRVRGIELIAGSDPNAATDQIVDFSFRYRPERRASLDAYTLRQTEELWLPYYVDDATRRAVKFEQNDAVDMTRLTPKEASGGRLTWSIELGLTDYYTFAVSTDMLDTHLADRWPNPPAPTLRQLWGPSVTFADLPTLPAPARVGVGVALMDKEGVLIALRRSRFVREAATGWHFVGEGMEPEDCAGLAPDPPANTAYRALRQELALQPTDIAELRMTSFAFDEQRWQPIFTFLARLAITANDLERRILAAVAEHRCEFSGDVLRLGSSLGDPEILRLLTGPPGKSGTLASNHAQWILAACLMDRFGFEEMERAFSRA